jgi:putative SOS response-associated peptidase YedK
MTRRDRAEVAAMLARLKASSAITLHASTSRRRSLTSFLTTRDESRKVIAATWGLVNAWAKDASRASMCIKAKAETVDRLPSFREAFERRRCVVPADGFYEWRGPKTRCEPLWICPVDEGLLLFAGLYEAWQREPGEWQTTFTIITTSANRLLERIHNRMPVILDEGRC